VRLWKVGPELKTFHHAVVVSPGHFLVNDAAPRRHPLHVARRDDTFVSHAVAVLDIAFQDVGNRLDAAMGVPRKAFDVLIRIGIAKIIKKKKRVKERNFAVSENPPEMNSCSFHRGFAFEHFADFSVLCHRKPSLTQKSFIYQYNTLQGECMEHTGLSAAEIERWSGVNTSSITRTPVRMNADQWHYFRGKLFGQLHSFYTYI
jgi:hypothetical protein